MALNLNSRALAIGLTGILAVGIVGGATVAFAGDEGSAPGDGEQTQRHRPHRHPGIRIGVRAIVNTCDITVEDLKAGAEAGQTINDILSENGQDPADCKSAVLAKAEERLAQAVADGKIDEEKKAKALEKASTGLDRLMAHELGSRLR